MASQPIDKVEWVHREKLKPNNYNPNAVAPPELKLLKISILEDGWTQPIVINPDLTIVDGFHRYTVSGHKELIEKFAGMVPVVMIIPKDEASQKMATIRHNRARGTHTVLKMADIIESMLKDGCKMPEICERLQMEEEEVIRLANRKGIPKTKLISGKDFGKAWQPS